MVSTPAYGGHVTTNYVNSFVRTQAEMPDYIQLVLNLYPGDSLITRGRNTMAAQFLASDCDAMLFIDADIGWDPHHITRLIGSKRDVIGGVYPIKEFIWDKLIQAVKDNPEAAGYDDVAPHSMNLVTNGIGKPNHLGYAPVYELGTGFMLIQRHVFEKMMEHYPDMWYTTDRRNGENFKVFNFFDAFVVEAKGIQKNEDGTEEEVTSKRYLSEDYAFCALWRQMGGETWVDVGTNMLSHQGSYTWGQP